DSLANFALRIAVFEKKKIGVRVHVDEARRDDEAFGIDYALRRARKRAADGDQSIAANRHLAVEPRVAGAVDDPAIANQEIVTVLSRVSVRREGVIGRRLVQNRQGQDQRVNGTKLHNGSESLVSRYRGYPGRVEGSV